MSDKWNKRFIDLAKEIGSWSKDPSTQVGSVVVDPKQKRILATGYNGFPRKISDTEFRLNNKDTKYKFVVHAEMNCIYNASLNGVSLNNSDLYVYGLPICSECAKGIIQVGIKNVFMCHPVDISDTWKNSYNISKELFKEAEINASRFDADYNIIDSI